MQHIKRADLYLMWKLKEYVQECCEHASQVYCNSIYFFGGSSSYITWECGVPEEEEQYSTQTRSRQDLILDAINGACKTNFVFVD